MKKILLLITVFFVFSCDHGSSYEAPQFYFEGKFSPSLVDNLDSYLKNLSRERGFRVFEKDRREMKVLTQGQDAFYISLYKESSDKPVLWISNVGVGTVLSLGLFSRENFSPIESKKLADELVFYLKEEMNVQMLPVSPNPHPTN